MQPTIVVKSSESYNVLLKVTSLSIDYVNKKMVIIARAETVKASTNEPISVPSAPMTLVMQNEPAVYYRLGEMIAGSTSTAKGTEIKRDENPRFDNWLSNVGNPMATRTVEEYLAEQLTYIRSSLKI